MLTTPPLQHARVVTLVIATSRFGHRKVYLFDDYLASFKTDWLALCLVMRLHTAIKCKSVDIIIIIIIVLTTTLRASAALSLTETRFTALRSRLLALLRDACLRVGRQESEKRK